MNSFYIQNGIALQKVMTQNLKPEGIDFFENNYIIYKKLYK